MYVREIARVDGKPKVISQVYLGSPEKVAAMAGGQSQELSSLKVEEFGALWLAREIDREIGLCEIVDEFIPREKRRKAPLLVSISCIAS